MQLMLPLLFNILEFFVLGYLIMTNNEENICWFHRNLSREQADVVLKKGIFIN